MAGPRITSKSVSYQEVTPNRAGNANPGAELYKIVENKRALQYNVLGEEE